MSSNMHKSVVSFPQLQQDLQPGHNDESTSYLDYLLDLADRLFQGRQARDEDHAA